MRNTPIPTMLSAELLHRLHLRVFQSHTPMTRQATLQAKQINQTAPQAIHMTLCTALHPQPMQRALQQPLHMITAVICQPSHHQRATQQPMNMMCLTESAKRLTLWAECRNTPMTLWAMLQK